MNKTSKITVKHFLNERLKPEIEKGVEKYPVFCMILYNRHTIIRKSYTFTRLSKVEFESKKYAGKYKKSIELSLKYELDLLYRIIEAFALDKQKNIISNNFLNFDSRYSYKSKNKELNQLNSYLNYYISNVNEALQRFVYSENVVLEFKNKLEQVFNFGDNVKIKEDLLNVFYNDEIFASDWSEWDNMSFLKNNVSSQSLEYVFLSFCFEKFEIYIEKKVSGYWCVPLFEWIYNFKKISDLYTDYIISNKEVIEFSEKLELKLTNKIIEKQLEVIKTVTYDDEFYLKYRS